MYNLYVIPEASTELGWDVGLPLILALILFALAVPIWVALGFAAIGLLVMTEVLPLTLFGDLATAVLACVAIYWSMDPVLVSLKFGNVTDGLRIVRAWFLIAVPLGFSMMMLRLIQSILRDLRDIRDGRPVFTGTKLFD